MASKPQKRRENQKNDKKKTPARRSQAEQAARELRRNHQIMGILLIALGLFLLLAGFSFTGALGEAINGFLTGLLGILGRFLCFVCMVFGIYTMAMAGKDKITVRALLFCAVMVCVATMFHVGYAAKQIAGEENYFSFIANSFTYGRTRADAGGFFGSLLSYPLVALLGSLPSYLVFFAGIVVLTVMFTNLSIQGLGETIGGFVRRNVDTVRHKQQARQRERRPQQPAAAQPPKRPAAHTKKQTEKRQQQQQIAEQRAKTFRLDEITLDPSSLEHAQINKEVPATRAVSRPQKQASSPFNLEVGEPSRRPEEKEKENTADPSPQTDMGSWMKKQASLTPPPAESTPTDPRSLIHDPQARERWDAVHGEGQPPKPKQELALPDNVLDETSPSSLDTSYSGIPYQYEEEMLDHLARESLDAEAQNQSPHRKQEEMLDDYEKELEQDVLGYPLDREAFLPPIPQKRKKSPLRYGNGEEGINLNMGDEQDLLCAQGAEQEDVDVFMPPQPQDTPGHNAGSGRRRSNILPFPGGVHRDAASSFADLDMGEPSRGRDAMDYEVLHYGARDADPEDDEQPSYTEAPGYIGRVAPNTPSKALDVEQAFLPEEDEDEALRRWEEETLQRNRQAAQQQAWQDDQNAWQAVDEEEDEPEEYEPPDLSLLQMPLPNHGLPRENMDHKGMLLEETLQSFGLKASVVSHEAGPTLTRFEVQLAPGVRINKITNLADDIAMNMGVARVRIAPIPSKAAVGVEIPNKEGTAVMLGELLRHPVFADHPSKVAVALGKDITGQVIVADLAKMPHLLIAGATGSGKSVCINGIICSILYHSSPDEVRMILVDPKVVELASFANIPHLHIPVVTNPNKAATALNKAVAEMEIRYRKFAALGVRDLSRYNQVVAREGGYIFKEGSDYEHEHLPQLVIIIDELADLMMVAAKEVEDAICRIAQMGRAAGIHLVLATQRPSADVITGLIKANVPSRIAFAVASGTDSRIILDKVGADKLLGRGDMLYQPIGKNEPLRVQGALVTDDEIEQIREHFENTQQNRPRFDPAFQSAMEKGEDDPEGGSGVSDDMDDMLPEAVEMLMQNGTASTSMLQRRLRVGYTRAARMIDQMEELSIVSEQEGSKARRILIDRDGFEQIFGYPPNIPPMGI